jgi:hypothetical protein
MSATDLSAERRATVAHMPESWPLASHGVSACLVQRSHRDDPGELPGRARHRRGRRAAQHASAGQDPGAGRLADILSIVRERLNSEELVLGTTRDDRLRHLRRGLDIAAFYQRAQNRAASANTRKRRPDAHPRRLRSPESLGRASHALRYVSAFRSRGAARLLADLVVERRRMLLIVVSRRGVAPRALVRVRPPALASSRRRLHHATGAARERWG